MQTLDKSVECLSTAFATFSSLGYSGQVVLNRGEGDLDIRNYGIKILVKFRDRDMLQPLKASVQSGGEKSVSTALYILALVLFFLFLAEKSSKSCFNTSKPSQ